MNSNHCVQVFPDFKQYACECWFQSSEFNMLSSDTVRISSTAIFFLYGKFVLENKPMGEWMWWNQNGTYHKNLKKWKLILLFLFVWIGLVCRFETLSSQSDKGNIAVWTHTAYYVIQARNNFFWNVWPLKSREQVSKLSIWSNSLGNRDEM